MRRSPRLLSWTYRASPRPRQRMRPRRLPSGGNTKDDGAPGLTLWSNFCSWPVTSFAAMQHANMIRGEADHGPASAYVTSGPADPLIGNDSAEVVRYDRKAL